MTNYSFRRLIRELRTKRHDKLHPLRTHPAIVEGKEGDPDQVRSGDDDLARAERDREELDHEEHLLRVRGGSSQSESELA